ncbi:MAG: hypothetical protein RLZ95_435 [Bacteroidota bacterium]|jgi:hypothetical protein
MKPFLMTILCFSLFACTTNTQKTASNELWHFNAKQNNVQLDGLIQPIITGYQDLLKSLSTKDTFYIRQKSSLLIQIADSLAGLPLTTDTLLKKNWINGLGNFNAELQGVIESNASQDLKELTLSMNMATVQLLNLLSEIGYKQHSIYVFNASNEYIEDGVYWFGIQKRSINPFNYVEKVEMNAMGVLQEMR